jgi:hypothetical protein
MFHKPIAREEQWSLKFINWAMKAATGSEIGIDNLIYLLSGMGLV